MNKWLQNDLVLRLISVAIAILMWFSVTDASFPYPDGESYQTRIRDVSIEADYNSDRFQLVNMTKKAELSLYGDKYTLEHLPPSYRIYVDLTKLGAGTHHKVPVQVSGLPEGIRAEVEPTTITVTLEEKIQREMPIEVLFVGKLAEGYKIGEPILNYNKALIRGSESRLSKVTSVKAVINLEGVSSSIKKLVKLQAYDERGPVGQIYIFPEVVNVEVPIQSPNKEVPLRIDIGKGPPPGYAIEQIDVNVDKVLVYGAKSYLDSLQYYTGPKIDLSDVKEDVKIQKEISLNGEVVKVDPKEVSIYVKIVPAITKTLEKVPIQVTGVSPGLKVSIITPVRSEFNITLSGAPKLLEQVNLDDIKASVDVSNLPAGRHEVPIRFKLPSYIEVIGQQNLKATVQLTP